MSSTTPTTSTPFTLTRASLSDIPEIARLMYRCFPTLVREVLMGCNSEADLPRFIAFHEDEFRTHHHAVWVKVVDATSGRIAAASRWKVYPNAGTPADGGDKVMSWLDDERRAQAERILGSMNAAREQANPGGFVRTLMPGPPFIPLLLPPPPPPLSPPFSVPLVLEPQSTQKLTKLSLTLSYRPTYSLHKP